MEIRSESILQFYVCPVCKKVLLNSIDQIRCSSCNSAYSLNRGIISFLSKSFYEDEKNSTAIKKAYRAFFNILAPIYESAVWYQLTLNISGAKGNSIKSIAEYISDALSGIDGDILDIACGPATYGRRIASPSRTIYGIDLSIGMLLQGRKYLAKQKIDNVYLAQATADCLPFKANVFNGVICAGSLHLFDDPEKVLVEIAKTMKKGAPLVLQTFLQKNKTNKPSFKEKTGFHFFTSDELNALLNKSGYYGIEIEQKGTILYARSKCKKE